MHHMHRRLGLFVLLAALVGATGCQSKEEAVRLACDAPNKVNATLPPAERGRALADYIDKNVKNGEVLALLGSAEPPTDKARKLEVMAASASVQECALATLWSKAPPPLRPFPEMSGAPPHLRPPALETQVFGQLSVDLVNETMQKHTSALQACYKAGIRRDKTLNGVVLMRFVIGEDGKVTEAVDAGSALPDEEVIKCLLEEVRKIEFPKPKSGTVTVLFPIQLRLSSPASSASVDPGSSASAAPAPPPPSSAPVP
jgi:hypothetical protein